MIIMRNEENNYEVTFKGSISDVPTKLLQNEVETIYGERVIESSRFVLDLTVAIDHMSIAEYNRLVIMFGMSHIVNVEDTDTGEYYTKYYIAGDTLSLEDKEDYKAKLKYKKGALSMKKK
jgi:hypothetical protein